MVFYFVQRGESLYHIAKRYQTTVHAIVTANRLEDPNAICPGQALIIPRPGEVPSPPPGGIVHLVRPGETIFDLARRYGSTPAEIMRANHLAHPEFILPGQQLVIPERLDAGDEWPMAGRLAGRSAASPVHLEGRPSGGWQYRPRRRVVVGASAPVIRYDRVYVGLGDGAYYCIDAGSGRARWRLPVAEPGEGACGLPAPAVFDGLVYLGVPTGQLLAVDAYRGRPVWRQPLPGPMQAGPAVDGGVVYLGTLDGQVLAVEAKTGALAWRRPLSAPVPHPLAIGDGRVFAVDANSRLWALDSQTGDVHWQCQSPPALPVFAEVLVLAGGCAFDPATGEVVWQVPAETASPACLSDVLYFAGGAVDLFTGSYRWRLPAGGESPAPGDPAGGVVAAGGLVLAARATGVLEARQTADGTPVWEVDLGALPAHAPAVAAGSVVVTLTDGSVRLVRVRPDRQFRTA